MNNSKIVAMTRVSSRNQSDLSLVAQERILRGETLLRGGTIIDVIPAPRRKK